MNPLAESSSEILVLWNVWCDGCLSRVGDARPCRTAGSSIEPFPISCTGVPAMLRRSGWRILLLSGRPTLPWPYSIAWSRGRERKRMSPSLSTFEWGETHVGVETLRELVLPCSREICSVRKDDDRVLVQELFDPGDEER